MSAQPTLPLTYEQALAAPRVFENKSFRTTSGLFSEL